ncbi:MAG: hypothetical protein J6X88_12165 [Bacteroidales bacterium]|nr:hypothetical protein [Bacteroidales bacterium]
MDYPAFCYKILLLFISQNIKERSKYQLFGVRQRQIAALDAGFTLLKDYVVFVPSPPTGVFTEKTVERQIHGGQIASVVDNSPYAIRKLFCNLASSKQSAPCG